MEEDYHGGGADYHFPATNRRFFMVLRPCPPPCLAPDLWPQLFSDVNSIALWISSEKILTRLYSVLHWFTSDSK